MSKLLAPVLVMLCAVPCFAQEQKYTPTPTEIRFGELFLAAERFDAVRLAECNRLLPESKSETLRRLVGVASTASLIDVVDKQKQEPQHLTADQIIERLFDLSHKPWMDGVTDQTFRCTTIRMAMSYGFATQLFLGAVYPSPTFDRFTDKKENP